MSKFSEKAFPILATLAVAGIAILVFTTKQNTPIVLQEVTPQKELVEGIDIPLLSKKYEELPLKPKTSADDFLRVDDRCWWLADIQINATKSVYLYMVVTQEEPYHIYFESVDVTEKAK